MSREASRILKQFPQNLALTVMILLLSVWFLTRSFTHWKNKFCDGVFYKWQLFGGTCSKNFILFLKWKASAAARSFRNVSVILMAYIEVVIWNILFFRSCRKRRRLLFHQAGNVSAWLPLLPACLPVCLSVIWQRNRFSFFASVGEIYWGGV